MALEFAPSGRWDRLGVLVCVARGVLFSSESAARKYDVTRTDRTHGVRKASTANRRRRWPKRRWPSLLRPKPSGGSAVFRSIRSRAPRPGDSGRADGSVETARVGAKPKVTSASVGRSHRNDMRFSARGLPLPARTPLICGIDQARTVKVLLRHSRLSSPYHPQLRQSRPVRY